jgi:hypothetical protein
MAYIQSTGYYGLRKVNGCYGIRSAAMLLEQILKRFGHQRLHSAAEADGEDLQAVAELFREVRRDGHGAGAQEFFGDRGCAVWAYRRGGAGIAALAGPLGLTLPDPEFLAPFIP